MICRKCNAAIVIPGEAPGLFLIVFAVLFGSGVVCALLDYWWVAGFLLLASLYAAVATWINLGDSRSMAADGSALPGVRCKGCHHVNKLRPWSL